MVVEGDIFNPGPATYPVPALKVALRDAANREVQFRIVDPPASQLSPGDVAHFRFPVAHPVAAATGVVVTFSGPAR